tara:strand:+ start:1722 stop:2453 length:732 start_codon:yes stop_codon:yes gene_type:complete
MSIEAWENRYTVRKFSETNREINPEHLKYLETALNNLPYQCNIKSDVWVYLGSSDRDLEFRKWLMENIYNMYNQKHSFQEHMLPVLQAPGIMLCCKTNKPWLDGAGDRSSEDIEDLGNRAEGIFTGVILSTIINFGYKAGTYRCTEGLERYSPMQKLEYFTNYIKDRYEKELAHMFQTEDPEEFKFSPGTVVAFGPEDEKYIDKKTGKTITRGTNKADWNGYGFHSYKIEGRKFDSIPSCIFQ